MTNYCHKMTPGRDLSSSKTMERRLSVEEGQGHYFAQIARYVEQRRKAKAARKARKVNR